MQHGPRHALLRLPGVKWWCASDRRASSWLSSSIVRCGLPEAQQLPEQHHLAQMVGAVNGKHLERIAPGRAWIVVVFASVQPSVVFSQLDGVRRVLQKFVYQGQPRGLVFRRGGGRELPSRLPARKRRVILP